MCPVPVPEPQCVQWYASVAVREYRGDKACVTVTERLGQLGRVVPETKLSYLDHSAMFSGSPFLFPFYFHLSAWRV